MLDNPVMTVAKAHRLTNKSYTVNMNKTLIE